jgi:hypothetical protein
VNKQDLEELEKSIIRNMNEGFTNHHLIMRKERQEDLQKMGKQLEKDAADLRKMIEAKLSGLETRVVALEESLVDSGGLVDRIKALEASIKDSEMAIPEEIALIDKKRTNVEFL